MTRRPPVFLANLAAAGVAAGWLGLYAQPWYPPIAPLADVLLLLLVFWTRRPWQLWGLAALMILVPLFRAGNAAPWLATSLGVLAATGMLHFILLAWARLSGRPGQEEEIDAQTAELARQKDAIESRARELKGQNDALQTANTRLGAREEMLQQLLQSWHATGPEESAALTGLCQRALEVIGAPAHAIALFEADSPQHLGVVRYGGAAPPPLLREDWPATDALAQRVMQGGDTVVIPDLQDQPDLAPPFRAGAGARCLAAAPLLVEQHPIGVFLACGPAPSPWSAEQVRLLELVAAKCTDILEAIRWRRTLTSRTEQLNEALLAKDDFLSRLSHELRTPLTPVLAAAGVLAEDRRLPPDVREDLAMIRNNVTIQSRLIDDLLDLTRLERGTLELHRQDCAVAPLLEDAAAIVASDLDASEQRLTIRSEVPAHCLVHGDPARLQQALWNLLQNASKFSPPGSRIELGARLLPDNPPRVSITVDDEGPGIGPDDPIRVFKAFDQIRKTRQANEAAGRGLGLAIAKAVVEQHGGQLTASANPDGQGARFTIELPATLVPFPAEAATGGQAGPPPPREPGAKILLVEDHYDTGRVIVRLLKAAGHDVVHARDATEALRRFSQEKFDLVISDLGLPDESGLVLMAKLRELQPDLPGLCMSGYGMESDLQACKEAGFMEHLTKPVEVPRLLEAIKRTLRRAGHASPA
jgi:signal transduction histidine kinase/CheY-like chemotaxis protein